MTSSSRGAAALAAIDGGGVVAIIRGSYLEEIEAIVDALIAGGIRAIEISLTSADAHEQIERAVTRAGARAVIGAGTVLDVAAVEAVFDRGAAFVVSPVVEPAVIGAAVERGMLAIPGAYTPTEIVKAINLGAAAVKLFPADTLPPAFVRAILAPLPGLKLVPTGGVTLPRAHEYAAAGAWAVGVGTPLVSAPIDAPTIADRASRFVAALRPSAESAQ